MNARYVWLVLLLCLVASPAQSGGFEVNENAANISARSGAFTAKADHPMAIHYNPAGLVNWKGNRIYVGSNLNLLSLEFDRAGIDARSLSGHQRHEHVGQYRPQPISHADERSADRSRHDRDRHTGSQ